MTVNAIDILLILLVLLSIVRGTQQGFVVGMLGLVGWIGSLLLALRFYEPLAAWLGPRVSWSEAWDRPAAFLLLVLAGGGLIVLLGDALLRRLPRNLHRHSFNRLLGALPGMVHGLITAAIVATLLLTLPVPQPLQKPARDSMLANQAAEATERAEAALSPVFSAAIAQTLTTLTIQPDADETVELPFQVSRMRPRPDLEARMLELVNVERQKEGLAPLEADPELTEVARRHSADMLERGYFSHTSAEGLSPFDRMNAAGVTYHIAGENLALAPTLELAHEGLMRSPGHRANILRPQFGRLGIGILDAGPHGLMVTQNFRN